MSSPNLIEWSDGLYEVYLDRTLAKIKEELMESKGIPLVVIYQLRHPLGQEFTYEFMAPETISTEATSILLRTLLDTLEGQGE